MYKYAEEIDHNENIEFERFREESQGNLWEDGQRRC